MGAGRKVLDLSGRVYVTATLCYTTNVDPHHPGNYTRAGLEATFRPNSSRYTKPEQSQPDSKPFFGKAQKGLTEEELRRDAWKWENTLHARVGFLGTSLDNPAFDIHYNSRMEGHNHNPGQELRYAMVITVQASREADLYDRSCGASMFQAGLVSWSTAGGAGPDRRASRSIISGRKGAASVRTAA